MCKNRSATLSITSILCLFLLTSCSTSTTQAPTPTPTPDVAPQHFNAHTFLQGVWRPDDLAFDPAVVFGSAMAFMEQSIGSTQMERSAFL
jgi:hypothetical protein